MKIVAVIWNPETSDMLKDTDANFQSIENKVTRSVGQIISLVSTKRIDDSTIEFDTDRPLLIAYAASIFGLNGVQLTFKTL